MTICSEIQLAELVQLVPVLELVLLLVLLIKLTLAVLHLALNVIPKMRLTTALKCFLHVKVIVLHRR